MKKEEVNYLVDLKMKEGKPFEQAKEEILRDVKFLKEHKQKIKQVKQELKLIEREKIKQKKKFNKEFARMIKQQEKLKNPIEFKPKGKFCHTKYMQRILNFLAEEPKSSRKRINVVCGVPYHQLNDGLLFMTKYNLTTKETTSGGDVYSVK
jgi:seryl-tRNA(Sec) selenium transferase